MSKGDLMNEATPKLIERYVSLLLQQYAVRHHTDDAGVRDVGPWNRLMRLIMPVVREIRRRGDEGTDALLPLLYHPNVRVRFGAAVQCLRQRPQKALPVLEEMARTNDLRESGVDPEDALDRWHRGEWLVD